MRTFIIKLKKELLLFLFLLVLANIVTGIVLVYQLTKIETDNYKYFLLNEARRLAEITVQKIEREPKRFNITRQMDGAEQFLRNLISPEYGQPISNEEFLLLRRASGSGAILQHSFFHKNSNFNSDILVKLVAQKMEGDAEGFTEIEFDGRHIAVAYAPVKKSELSVVALYDLEDIEKTFPLWVLQTLVFFAFLIAVPVYYHRRAARRVINSLRYANKKYDSYLSLAPMGIFVLNSRGAFEEINKSFCLMTGYSEKEIMRLKIFDLLDKGQGIENLSNLHGLINQGNTEFSFIRKEGFPCFMTMKLNALEENKYIGMCMDSTMRKSNEEAVRVSREKFKAIFDAASEAIIMIGPNAKIQLWNRAAEKIFKYNYQEALNQEVTRLIVPEARQKAAARSIQMLCANDIRREFKKPIRMKLQNRKMQEIISIISFSRMIVNDKAHLIFMIRDDTKTAEMESQLLQTAKMATLGEMAAGIAHELNQPLSVISMGAQLMQMQTKQGVDISTNFIQEQSDMICKNIDRASRIINNLRTFGRKSSDVKKPVDIHIAIQGAMELVDLRIRQHNIRVSIDIDSNMPNILGDENSLEQVFVNIILNAIDALDSDINLENKEINIRCKHDKEYLTIAIENNGPQIPDQIVEKIFNPFFTTKPTGKGTGLGLSITYGIINAHKGVIKLDQAKGKIRFIIQLPVLLK